MMPRFVRLLLAAVALLISTGFSGAACAAVCCGK